MFFCRKNRSIKRKNYYNTIVFLRRKLSSVKHEFHEIKIQKVQLINELKVKKRWEIDKQKAIINDLKHDLSECSKKYKITKKNELKRKPHDSQEAIKKLDEILNTKSEIRKKIKYNKLLLSKIHQKNLFDDWPEYCKIGEIKDEIRTTRLLNRDNDASLISFKNDFDKENHIFEIRNLNFWHEKKRKQVLFDVNVDIKKNKVTALIGPSGCGKSTFIKCLNRMHDFTPGTSFEGNIWFQGKNIFSKILSPLELRTRVGMVFQQPTPFPSSIFENVAYSLRCHGLYDKTTVNDLVKEALIDAALWDEVKDNLQLPATSLSGGQQQRLCIARAVILKPSVLLMDEPTSALDPIAVSKIEQLIYKLKKDYTIIIVTHSMAQAQRISDETIFFYRGKIIEVGLTREFFMNPKNQQTKDYISGKIG